MTEIKKPSKSQKIKEDIMIVVGVSFVAIGTISIVYIAARLGANDAIKSTVWNVKVQIPDEILAPTQ